MKYQRSHRVFSRRLKQFDELEKTPKSQKGTKLRQSVSKTRKRDPRAQKSSKKRKKVLQSEEKIARMKKNWKKIEKNQIENVGKNVSKVQKHMQKWTKKKKKVRRKTLLNLKSANSKTRRKNIQKICQKIMTKTKKLQKGKAPKKQRSWPTEERYGTMMKRNKKYNSKVQSKYSECSVMERKDTKKFIKALQVSRKTQEHQKNEN